MATILLVDDDRTMREGFRALLVGEGYSVRTARDGVDALAKYAEVRPDLVLLDVMMPKLNGYSVCSEIRKTDRTVPIIFLTAKDSEAEEIRGLNLGADDFVSKSQSQSVLLSRVRRAVLRAIENSAGQAQMTNKVRLGSVTVDFDSHSIINLDRTVCDMTVLEEALLRCLLAQRGVTVSTDDILTYLHGKNYVGGLGLVRCHVMNLRKKLGPAGGMIVTVHGGGYYLVK